MNSYYIEILTDSDLCNETYSLDILKKYINNLNKKVVLSTQKLTAQFCIKYILDTAIDSGSETRGVYTKEHIIRRQPHITSEEFDKYYLEYVNVAPVVNAGPVTAPDATVAPVIPNSVASSFKPHWGK